jgi:hypothetical protein
MATGIVGFPMKCASCGAALTISPSMERFCCGYCGTEQIVERFGGTVSLRIIADAVTKVQIGTDKTAAELALVRLEKESNELNQKIEKWDDYFSHKFKEIKPWKDPALVLLDLVAAVVFVGMIPLLLLVVFGPSTDVGGTLLFLELILIAYVAFRIYKYKSYPKNKRELEEGRRKNREGLLKARESLDQQIAQNRRTVSS